MAIARRRRKFRVELRRDEPRMSGQLDDFHQPILGKAGEAETGRRVPVHVRVVELVAMTVPLEHGLVAVDGTRQRVRRDAYFLRAEAHGAALAGGVVALLLTLGDVLPLGDECDNGMRTGAVELGAVRIFEAERVAAELDRRELHAEADAEIRNLV